LIGKNWGFNTIYPPEYREELKRTLQRLSEAKSLKVSPSLVKDIKGNMLSVFLDTLYQQVTLDELKLISKVSFKEDEDMQKPDPSESLRIHMLEVEVEFAPSSGLHPKSDGGLLVSRG